MQASRTYHLPLKLSGSFCSPTDHHRIVKVIATGKCVITTVGRDIKTIDLLGVEIRYRLPGPAGQTGEEIRSSLVRDWSGNQAEVHYLVENEYNPNAPKVDGEWKSGGDRRIIFFNKPDGTVGFKFEKFGR